MYDYFSNQDDIEVVDSLDNIDVFFIEIYFLLSLQNVIF